MAEDRQEQGTEDPTQRRRERAREEGQVVQSPEVASAFALLVSGLILLWFGRSMGRTLTGGIRTWLSEAITSWSPQMDFVVVRWLSWQSLVICSVPVLLMLVVAFSIALIQTGPIFALTPLSIKFEKLAPANNWKKLMSLDNGLKSLLAIFKVVVAFVGTSIFFYWNWQRYGDSVHSDFATTVTQAWDAGVFLWLCIAAFFLTPAAADYLFKRYQHEQKLKMTRDEIKREQKDDMGDPVIRQRQRQRQREAAEQRSTSKAKEATVVLTNPTHLAVALKYETGMSAPVVVAKGAGVFAKNIVKIAKENRIEVVQRKPLARAIYKNIKVGQEIPPEFFRAVAEILAQIYRMRRAAV